MLQEETVFAKVADKIRLTGSWTNLVGKVFLSIVTFDQLGGPDSRLADRSGRFRQIISPRPMTGIRISL